MEHVVIIGNGIAGITTARHLRKRSNARITVIGQETKYFYSRTALMYIFMGHMKFEHTKPYEEQFWKKNRIDLVHDRVSSVDFNNRRLNLGQNPDIEYDKLVIATGSRTATFGWPGMQLEGVRGLYSLQDMEYLLDRAGNAQQAVIVGGGLVGIELAEMLVSKGLHVTMLIREDGYWRNVLPVEEAKLVERHAAEHGVDILLQTELKEIRGEDAVTSVITSTDREIPCQLVGLTTGVVPNIDWIANTELETDKGILANEYLETNIPGVYTAGDCVQLRNPPAGRKPIEPVWYVGRKMGEMLGKHLAGERNAYAPGPWFNSAKFFDIEYQTYGIVDPDPEAQTFYWESEDGKRCFRAVWNTSALLGINVFGIRLRHEVVDAWLRKAAGIDEVMQQLPKASFDPEFSKDDLREVQQSFSQSFPDMAVTLEELPWYQRIFSA